MKRYVAFGIFLLAAAFAACSQGPGTTPLAPAAGPAVSNGALRQRPVQLDGRVNGIWYHAAAIQGMAPPHGRGLVPHMPRYLSDLTNHKGTMLVKTKSRFIFVNCELSCFGSPVTFMANLEKSTMIHLVDQYVGSKSDGRYTNGGTINVVYPSSVARPAMSPTSSPTAVPPTSPPASATPSPTASPSPTPTPGPLGFGDFVSILQDAIDKVPNHPVGTANIYHIFLPKGTDFCLDPYDCYSPDHFATWDLCAFHSGVNTKYGMVYFSVIGYENVKGCWEGPIPPAKKTPNGTLADSTDSMLSHEFFEMITDSMGNAWWNSISWDLYRYEIADECQTVDFLGVNVKLNAKPYQIQQEYSNSDHACMP